MNKTNKKALIVAIIIVAIIVISVPIAIFVKKPKETVENPDNEPITDGEIVQPVNPEEAGLMYEEISSKCNGAYVWNIQEGEVVEIDNIEDFNTCVNEDHYSKMIAYSYNGDDVVIYVNVLKKVDNALYKLDGTYVIDYDESIVNDYLNAGTTYMYTYKKLGDNKYQLSKVELMPTD